MRILICFDGTGNQPIDAEQQLLEDGSVEDDNITNVLKLHLLAGGNLRAARPERGDGAVAGQHSLYFSGVGTRGSVVRRAFRKAFAGLGPRRSIRAAREELARVYERGDTLAVFGFSRGAAIARRFVSEIAESGLATRSGVVDPVPDVRLLGVWDTVVSKGLPELETDELPEVEELGEKNGLSPIVDRALHLVALDERRLAFRPTLMNEQAGVEEIWMPGVHSDVGGGFRLDGLSDIALEVMLAAGRAAGLGFLDPASMPRERIVVDQEGADVTIGRDDLVITPDVTAVLHQQVRNDVKSQITLRSRDPFVLRDGQPAPQGRPVVHHTVVDRIRADPSYRPASLDGVPHLVLHPDGTTEAFGGLADHV